MSESQNSANLAQQQARAAYAKMATSETRFAKPVRKEDLQNALAIVDAPGWLGPRIQGQRVLCLAAGGGRQSALYAAAGGLVTVVDISPEMLRLDREVASEHGLNIATVEASMDDLSMFPDKHFDIVIQPVSSCYVPAVASVYQQVARVIVPAGIYVSQHKQPVSLQVGTQPSPRGYEITETYYRDTALPPAAASRLREAGTIEYLHRWEELVGHLCRAGFVIEDLLEPSHGDPQAAVGTFAHRGLFIAPYVRIKARRIGSAAGKIIV